MGLPASPLTREQQETIAEASSLTEKLVPILRSASQPQIALAALVGAVETVAGMSGATPVAVANEIARCIRLASQQLPR